MTLIRNAVDEAKENYLSIETGGVRFSSIKFAQVVLKYDSVSLLVLDMDMLNLNYFDKII